MMRPTSEPYECPPGDWKCITQELHKYGSMAVTLAQCVMIFTWHKHGVYEQQERPETFRLTRDENHRMGI